MTAPSNRLTVTQMNVDTRCVECVAVLLLLLFMVRVVVHEVPAAKQHVFCVVERERRRGDQDARVDISQANEAISVSLSLISTINKRRCGICMHGTARHLSLSLSLFLAPVLLSDRLSTVVLVFGSRHGVAPAATDQIQLEKKE